MQEIGTDERRKPGGAARVPGELDLAEELLGRLAHALWQEAVIVLGRLDGGELDLADASAASPSPHCRERTINEIAHGRDDARQYAASPHPRQQEDGEEKQEEDKRKATVSAVPTTAAAAASTPAAETAAAAEAAAPGLWTWEHADVSASDVYEGDLRAALRAIEARAVVLPSRSDLLFAVDDSEAEAEQIPNAELRPIPSSWGHLAGFGANPPDNDFIDAALNELLAT